jgi:hypothetical protein
MFAMQRPEINQPQAASFERTEGTFRERRSTLNVAGQWLSPSREDDPQ